MKSAKNTSCDTCALNSRTHKFSDISAHTVVKSRKKVNSAIDTISDTCAMNSLGHGVKELATEH